MSETRIREALLSGPIFGLPRELVARAEFGDSGIPQLHSFPRAWEIFEIAGSAPLDVIHEIAKDIVSAQQALAMPLPGYPIKSTRGLREKLARAPDRRSAQTLLKAEAAEHIYGVSDLALGACPFLVTVAFPGGGFILVGAEHAFIDGYSIDRIVREISKRHSPTQSEKRLGESVPQSALQGPTLRHDIRNYVTLLEPLIRGDFQIPGVASPKSQTWAATTALTWSIDRERVARIWGWSRMQDPPLSLSATFRAVAQISVSAWTDGLVPLMYSRLGRHRLSDLDRIGVMTESVIDVPADVKPSSTVADAVRLIAQSPPFPRLSGSWISDFLSVENLGKVRLASFNFLPPFRTFQIGEAVVNPGSDELYEIRPPVGRINPEKRNGVHISVWQSPDGGISVTVLAHEEVAGSVENYRLTIEQVLWALIEKGARVGEWRDAVRSRWH